MTSIFTQQTTAIVKPVSQVDPAPASAFTYELLEAQALEALSGLATESVDLILTDPPYGLGKLKDVGGLLRAWLDNTDPDQWLGKGGFMNAKWDKCVPAPPVWKECFRVLKPGGYLVAFGSGRTQDLLGISLRLGGFDYRDEVTHYGSLSWVYGSGVPKGKKLDELGLEDFHTALKPAHEPILLFAKPPKRGRSLTATIAQYGTGALNIGATRVKTNDNLNGGAYASGLASGADADADADGGTDRLAPKLLVANQPKGLLNPDEPLVPQIGNLSRSRSRSKRRLDTGLRFEPGGAGQFQTPAGRFPSNVVLTHTPWCWPVGTTQVKGITGTAAGRMQGKSSQVYGKASVSARAGQPTGYADAAGLETVEAWDCDELCPIRQLDQQSGLLQSGWLKAGTKPRGERTIFHSYRPGVARKFDTFADKGGASRFFPRFDYRTDYELHTEWLVEQLYYAAKASRAERTHGGRVANPHPTVKPLALLIWLLKLLLRPGRFSSANPPTPLVILDPFLGSGSTGVAARLLAQAQPNEYGLLHFIGVERDPAFIEIARQRLRAI